VQAAAPEVVLVAVPAAARVVALVVAQAAAQVLAVAAVQAAALEVVLVAAPAAARVAAGQALADRLVVPAEGLGAVPAAAQAAIAACAQPAHRVAFRPTQLPRIPALLGDPLRVAATRVNPPLAPRRKTLKRALRDPAATHPLEAEFISLGSGFLCYTPVSCWLQP